LTATVRKNHPALVNAVMSERNSCANSANHNPTPIEEIHGPTVQSEELDEPPTKFRGLHSLREDELDFPELAQDPWFHHGGRLDDDPMDDD
jgi:hypothetical protein